MRGGTELKSFCELHCLLSAAVCDIHWFVFQFVTHVGLKYGDILKIQK